MTVTPAEPQRTAKIGIHRLAHHGKARKRKEIGDAKYHQCGGSQPGPKREGKTTTSKQDISAAAAKRHTAGFYRYRGMNCVAMIACHHSARWGRTIPRGGGTCRCKARIR